MTVKTKCNTWTCLYIWESHDLFIVRSKIHIENFCEETFLPELVEHLLGGVYIPFQTEGMMKVYKNPNEFVFTSSWIENTFEQLDPCTLKPENGLCKALFVKYYFDPVDGRCKSFSWGGCGGSVPFETLEDCQMKCGN